MAKNEQPKKPVDNETENFLITTEEVYKRMGIGSSFFYKLKAANLIGPMPARLGSKNLWNPREFREWVDAGIPNREQWQQIRNSKGSEKN